MKRVPVKTWYACRLDATQSLPQPQVQKTRLWAWRLLPSLRRTEAKLVRSRVDNEEPHENDSNSQNQYQTKLLVIVGLQQYIHPLQNMIHFVLLTVYLRVQILHQLLLTFQLHIDHLCCVSQALRHARELVKLIVLLPYKVLLAHLLVAQESFIVVDSLSSSTAWITCSLPAMGLDGGSHLGGRDPVQHFLGILLDCRHEVPS
mmetsp:Transcript_110731/g.253687  ORF Transcript_110731/g.253687 Transcript_110731/m.253687 type:complete len:203 (+) Transcript_110731:128-736(+)